MINIDLKCATAGRKAASDMGKGGKPIAATAAVILRRRGVTAWQTYCEKKEVQAKPLLEKWRTLGIADPRPEDSSDIAIYRREVAIRYMNYAYVYAQRNQ